MSGEWKGYRKLVNFWIFQLFDFNHFWKFHVCYQIHKFTDLQIHRFAYCQTWVLVLNQLSNHFEISKETLMSCWTGAETNHLNETIFHTLHNKSPNIFAHWCEKFFNTNKNFSVIWSTAMCELPSVLILLICVLLMSYLISFCTVKLIKFFKCDHDNHQNTPKVTSTMAPKPQVYYIRTIHQYASNKSNQVPKRTHATSLDFVDQSPKAANIQVTPKLRLTPRRLHQRRSHLDE